MFIEFDDQGILLALRDCDRANLVRKAPILLGGGGLGLAPERETVLILLLKKSTAAWPS